MLGGGRAVPLTTSNAIVEKDKEIKELNRKNNYLRRQNDELLKGQFENENRVRWLTERLGFATAQEAETQLADSDITLLQLQVEYETAQARIRHLEEDALLNEEAYSVLRHEHDVTLKHNAELEQDLNELNWSRQCIQSSVESQVAELNLELHERASVIAKLQAQSVPLRSRVLSSSPAGKENIIVRRSQSFVPSSPQSPSKSTSPTRKKNVPSPAAFLQAQLNDLQERYDSLLRIYRENVQQRTKERKVWKEFKETWAEGIQRGRRDARRLELGQSGTDSPRKRRKMTEERERAATAAIQHASTPVQPKTPRPVQESQTQYEEDPLPPSQDQGGGAAIAGALTSEVLVPASSETDLEESQEQHEANLSHRPSTTDNRVPSTSTPRIPFTADLTTPRLPMPSFGQALGKHKMIDEPEAEADRTLVDVKGKGKASASPRTNQQPARALTGSRTSTPVSNLPTDREGRATALRYLNKLPNDQYADQYKAFKGHGRYSGNLPKTGEEGINTRFEIDKDKNNGMDYQYDSVVRNKETRRHMHGADCECCRDYYEAVGPLPLRLQPPLWKSPSPRKKRKLAISPPGPAALSHQNGETRAAEAVQSHKQEVSRHRQAWMRSNTPPDYWNIGFPTTQQVRAINRKAEEMHREKDREIELEAERGGRYKRRS